MSEAPTLVGQLREKVWSGGQLGSAIVKGKEAEGAKFSDYFEFNENIANMPSHRALAMLRGEKEGILKIDLDIPHDEKARHPAVTSIMAAFNIQDRGRAGDKWLAETARQAWKQRLAPSSHTDLVDRLKERSDGEAIRVFSRNMKDLLLAAPAGPKVVMGVDPGIRTGCKIAVVDATGKLLETATIYPHEPKKDWNGSLATLAVLAKKHGVAARLASATARPAARRTSWSTNCWRRCRTSTSRASPSRKPAPRSIPRPNSRRRNSPISTSACAAPSPSPAACRIRWPSW